MWGCIFLIYAALIALGFGIKSPGTGLSIAGAAIVIWYLSRWLSQSQEKWQREALEQGVDEQRQRIIREYQQALENPQLMVVAKKESGPWAFVSRFDAEDTGKVNGYGVVRAGKFFFLTSQQPKDSDLPIICRYLEFIYDTNQSASRGLKPIHIVEPSRKALEAAQEKERRDRVEQDRVLSACLSDIENRRACDLGSEACCVYIMVSEAATKIGISDQPEGRLRQVQTGHPSKLVIHKVWWFQSSQDALLVERATHGTLKLRGAHRSGEWFAILAQEAVVAVNEAIKHLGAHGEIDRGLFPNIGKPLSNLEMTLGKLLNQKWRISKKGNEYLKLDGNLITVFRRKRSWSYCLNNAFSEKSFSTRDTAKNAALQEILKAAPHNTNE